jgi:hypothetical protein
MATVTTPTRRILEKKPGSDQRTRGQLRRDRIVGLVMLVVMVLIAALVVWLATLEGGGANGFDYYYPMMP